MPLPIAGEVNRLTALHRQRGYAAHLIAVRDAAVTLPHRTKQSAQSAACGAAVLLSLGAIAIAEEQGDHLLAAPISYSDSEFPSICRGPAQRRSPDTTGIMESEIQRGPPLPYARGCRAQ